MLQNRVITRTQNVVTPLFCSAGILSFGMCLDLVSVSNFDFLCNVGGAPLAYCNLQTHLFISALNNPFASGGVSPKVELRMMSTNAALGEKCEGDVFDASSEDELPGERNQWVSVARALLSRHDGTCAREGAGS